ncbi:NUDIX domain-containing protein [Streptomyces sp. NPDC048416]|uniref:NUDIX domain-containing protein n=1 Tax=Streptomyces sp. NPDC048416 TaxID=3365546 RepID=UPI00371D6658
MVDDTVRVVALDKDGQVVLVEDAFYLQRGRVLHLPGGGTGGQTPLTAARRELEGGDRTERLRPPVAGRH